MWNGKIAAAKCDKSFNYPFHPAFCQYNVSRSFFIR